MMISDETRLQRSEELISAPVDNDLVLLSLQNSKYYGMGPVGKRVWELAAEPRTVKAICAQLLDEFDVAPDTCRQDVLAFVAQLAAAKLVTLSPET